MIVKELVVSVLHNFYKQLGQNLTWMKIRNKRSALMLDYLLGIPTINLNINLEWLRLKEFLELDQCLAAKKLTEDQDNHMWPLMISQDSFSLTKISLKAVLRMLDSLPQLWKSSNSFLTSNLKSTNQASIRWMTFPAKLSHPI